MIVLAAIGAALFTACAGDKLTIKNVKMTSTLKEGSGWSKQKRRIPM
jgi:hypothetical protein